MNTGAVVANLQHGQREAGNLFAHAHRNLQGRAVGGVAHGVGQQVRHDLTQTRFVAEHGCGGRCHLFVQAHQGHCTIGRRSVGVVTSVHRQVEQVEGRQLGFAALINTRQGQQVFHELTHTLGLRFDAAHRGSDSLVGR